MFNQNTNPYGYGTTQIQKVNGMQGAQAFVMPPNSSIILMDSSKDNIYVKSTDASGIASITAFECVPLTPPEQKKYEDLNRRLDNVEQLIKSLGANNTYANSNRQGESNNEQPARTQ